MPGKTGKRAKAPSPCAGCGQRIEGAYNRTKEGEFHDLCWWKKYYPDSPRAKSEIK